MFQDQLEAIDKFNQMKVGALFMAMGTGKTRTALELCRINQRNVDLVLWLAPKSTIANLQAELVQCEPLEVPLETYGYETIASSDKQYLRLLDRLNGKRIFLVCDESLYLKNGETKRWRRTNHIRQQFAEFVLILNGTPVTRDEMDIYWQMTLLSPQIIGLSENQFRNTMFTKHIDTLNHRVWWKSCDKNVAWLKSRISPYIFECDLKIDTDIWHDECLVSLSAEASQAYADAKRRLLKNIADENDTKIMAELSKMKMLVACDEDKNKMVAQYAKNVGQPTLLFCCYLDEMNQVKKHLPEAFVINGATSADERAKIIDEWNNGNRPLIMTYGVGAMGLNLQHSSQVILASLPWDYATYSQAIHRVYRRGQTAKKVNVEKFRSRAGICNLVDECIWRKTTLAELIRTVDWRARL